MGDHYDGLDPRPVLWASTDRDVVARVPWLHDAHRSRPTHAPITDLLADEPYSARMLRDYGHGTDQHWSEDPTLVWVRESVVWAGDLLTYPAVDGLPTVIRAPRSAWSPRRMTAPHMPRRFARLWLIRGEDGRYRRWTCSALETP